MIGRTLELMAAPIRLRITLDPDSSEPVFAQICSAIRVDVTSGRLTAGVRLPTTRALAAELDVAVNTVAKAYRELELEGVVEGRGRHGTYVMDLADTAAERETMRFVTTMRNLGMTREETLALVRRAWS